MSNFVNNPGDQSIDSLSRPPFEAEGPREAAVPEAPRPVRRRGARLLGPQAGPRLTPWVLRGDEVADLRA